MSNNNSPIHETCYKAAFHTGYSNRYFFMLVLTAESVKNFGNHNTVQPTAPGCSTLWQLHSWQYMLPTCINKPQRFVASTSTRSAF